ncbi:YbhQ family protein [Candidatus Pantoea carbekii]|uniref:Uncharacterized protein n=1 Tax=Candidatus Pantoea carbekii TaxID=1235990 RepID=U3U8B0_9GAMM|nr:YbhQ family protein [Candidatus Pantoea carbekii]AKC32180.1 inner membrane protein YbhQ [Candidatus Pantoea carbekii]BAO00707.1 hypothetical protein HHS_07370 [Candidatus Pantoea carbekii]
MKWFNLIYIITGKTCLYLSIRLSVIIAFIIGWKNNLLFEVGITLVLTYIIVFIIMIISQYNIRLRRINDSLEEVTTNYYFSTAMLILFLISRFIHNYALISFFGLVMLLGPTLFSIFVKTTNSYIEHH